LFAQVTENGELQLSEQTIGIDLGSDPEEILANFTEPNLPRNDVQFPDKRGSTMNTMSVGRDATAETHSRFNN